MRAASPSNVVTLGCLRNRCRTGAAIAGADRPAVATWYSSGWNRWWLVRSTSVMSTAASPSARVASSPPKPQPTMTMRGRRPGVSVAAGMVRLWATLLRRPGPCAKLRRMPLPLRLSVLDQSVARAGRPQDESIRHTVALAQRCEALGFHRFWLSEHHAHPALVGTA